MKPCHIPHQIIKAVPCYLPCRINIKPLKAFHNLCMVRDFKIWHNRFAKLFNLNIFTVIFANWNARVDNIGDYHHNFPDFFLQILFLGRKFLQTLCILRHLSLFCFCLFLFPLPHQSADFFRNLFARCTEPICFLLRFARHSIKLNYFIHQRKLILLELIPYILFYYIWVFPKKFNI